MRFNLPSLRRLWRSVLLVGLLALWALPAAAQTVSPLGGHAQRLDDVAKRVDDAVAAGDWATARQQWKAFQNLWLDVEDDFNDASLTDYNAIEASMAKVDDVLQPATPQAAAVQSQVADLRNRVAAAVPATAGGAQTPAVEAARPGVDTGNVAVAGAQAGPALARPAALPLGAGLAGIVAVAAGVICAAAVRRPGRALWVPAWRLSAARASATTWLPAWRPGSAWAPAAATAATEAPALPASVRGGAVVGSRAGWSWQAVGTGVVLGLLVAALGGLALVGPLALTHRTALPLERTIGGAAVSLAARFHAGSQPNPVAQDRRALVAGSTAYAGSCSVCHGAAGDGRGAYGQATFPPATDLRTSSVQAKSDAQLYWIIKNGLSFTGMPAFGDQYSDQDVWSLVSYVRTLDGAPSTQTGALVGAPASAQQFSASAAGTPVRQGATVYLAQGCAACHGMTGEAPGDLSLRRAGALLNGEDIIRRGKRGMPAYNSQQITGDEMRALIAYLGSLGTQDGRRS